MMTIMIRMMTEKCNNERYQANDKVDLIRRMKLMMMVMMLMIVVIMLGWQGGG